VEKSDVCSFPEKKGRTYLKGLSEQKTKEKKRARIKFQLMLYKRKNLRKEEDREPLPHICPRKSKMESRGGEGEQLTEKKLQPLLGQKNQ